MDGHGLLGEGIGVLKEGGCEDLGAGSADHLLFVLEAASSSVLDFCSLLGVYAGFLPAQAWLPWLMAPQGLLNAGTHILESLASARALVPCSLSLLTPPILPSLWGPIVLFLYLPSFSSAAVVAGTQGLEGRPWVWGLESHLSSHSGGLWPRDMVSLGMPTCLVWRGPRRSHVN